MHRRNFLLNCGILAPAIIAVPSAIIKASKKSIVCVLIVQEVFQHDAGFTASVKDAFKEQVAEIACTNIGHLQYDDSEFTVITRDNRIITSKKIILNTVYKINGAANSVEIKTDNKRFNIGYNSSKDKPEFWSFNSEKCSAEKLMPFVNRKGIAFLMING